MKFSYDFLPMIIFFIVYKMFDLFVATATVIAVSIIQVLFYWIKYRKLNKMLLTVSTLVVILGGITLLLHDEIFIKWKPTVVFWVIGIAFIGSQFFSKKSLIQRMLEPNIKLDPPIWRRLNLSWAAFFALMGGLNLVVVYNFSTDTWVNFKLFGILGFTLVFSIAQAIYLARYIEPADPAPTAKSVKKLKD